MASLGKNQSFAREVNNLLVLKALSKQSLSATELSTHFKLSNATLSSLLKNLSSLGLIEKVGFTSTSGLGRKMVKFSLSSTYGNILVVSLSSLECHAKLFTLKGEVLIEKEFKFEKYDLKTIEKVISSIKEGYEGPLNVRYTVLCMPGLVNKVSGELQVGSQFDASLFSSDNKLEKIFSNAFSCPVKIENDTKILMQGELANGNFDNSEFGMLTYVDYGLGGCFQSKGNILYGLRGYSGEIGRVMIENGSSYANIDDLCSIRYLKDKIEPILGFRPHTADIVSSFNQGNEKVRQIVLESGFNLGKGLDKINSVLDLDTIVISGRVNEFGADYFAAVRKGFASMNGCLLKFGLDNEEALFLGAKQLGITYIFNNAVKKEEVL